jgi:hypothetical protein
LTAASRPPEQGANLADNSRATKGGQMTRHQQYAAAGDDSSDLAR